MEFADEMDARASECLSALREYLLTNRYADVLVRDSNLSQDAAERTGEILRELMAYGAFWIAFYATRFTIKRKFLVLTQFDSKTWWLFVRGLSRGLRDQTGEEASASFDSYMNTLVSNSSSGSFVANLEAMARGALHNRGAKIPHHITGMAGRGVQNLAGQIVEGVFHQQAKTQTDRSKARTFTASDPIEAAVAALLGVSRSDPDYLKTLVFTSAKVVTFGQGAIPVLLRAAGKSPNGTDRLAGTLAAICKTHADAVDELNGILARGCTAGQKELITHALREIEDK